MKDEHLASVGAPAEAATKLLLFAVSQELADAVMRVLPGGRHGVHAAADAGELACLMERRCPSVVLVGGVSCDAVAESCRGVRGAQTCPDVVIVALAGDGPEEVALLLEAGADDVFVRSSGDAALGRRLQVASQTATAVAYRRAAQDARDQFFQLSTQLLCVLRDDHFTVVNPAWTKALGWSSEELTSTPWLDFVHPDDRQASTVARTGLVGDRPTGGFTNRYRCKDGTYRWLEWGGVLSSERHVIYAIVHDVTEARATKEALRELSERLATTLNSIGDGSYRRI